MTGMASVTATASHAARSAGKAAAASFSPLGGDAGGTSTATTINADGSTTTTVTNAQGQVVSTSTTSPVNQARLGSAFARQADRDQLSQLTAAAGLLNVIA